MITMCFSNIFFLETRLSESEKEEIVEFEMDCIANMMREKCFSSKTE